jgi:uncharacterized membrane protein
MLSRLSFSIYDLRDSLWYRPALMTLGAIVMAFVMIWIDEQVLQGSNLRTWWLFSGGVEGARGVLSAIAATMITVVTTAFSITMVTLQLSSSQYSPRILRGFTGDPGNQLVLGIFIATFVYCLLVLRSVRSELEDQRTFVPALAISLALVLALVCIGSLIYFLHHASRTIQASVILDKSANDTFGLIEDHFNVGNSERMSDRTRSLLDNLPVVAEVTSERPGYLRGMDDSTLVALARKYDLLLTLHPHVGNYIFTGSPLATVQRFTTRELNEDDEHSEEESVFIRLKEQIAEVLSPNSADAGKKEKDGNGRSEVEKISDAIRGTFTTGLERTLNEDVLFGFQQLADIGLRALSPGVNDPTTAMFCIDWLGEGLIRVQDTNDRPTVAVDEDGTPRVVYPPIPFEQFLTISFRHIRHYAAGDPFVSRHIIEVLESVYRSATNEQARAAVAEGARRTVEAHAASDPLPTELERVRMAASWAYTEDSTPLEYEHTVQT